MTCRWRMAQSTMCMLQALERGRLWQGKEAFCKMIQRLKGKKLCKYQAQLAEAVERFIDADMGSGR